MRVQVVVNMTVEVQVQAERSCDSLFWPFDTFTDADIIRRHCSLQELSTVLAVLRAPFLALYHTNLANLYQRIMSFQDIETGLAQRSTSPAQFTAQTPEEGAFLQLQSSLSLQVFKINANVQGILKLVDQLGTNRDSANLRKTLYVSPSDARLLEPAHAVLLRMLGFY